MKSPSIDELYRSYVPDIFSYLLFLCHNHHTAEDLLQETFFRAYLYLEDYHDERAKAWLFKVAYHVFIDHWRREKRIDIREADFFTHLANPESPEISLIQKEDYRELKEALIHLPDLQKQALLFYDFHHLTYQESAEILGISLAQFKISLFRARQKLREYRERKSSLDE